MTAPARSTADWSERWPRLARAAGITPEEKLLLALSGGADSVLLLHWLATARPRPDVRAAHVDHGLRGAESDGDARFSAELCRSLGVPFACLRAELDPSASGLEARARSARYTLLAAEAQRTGGRTLLTGHHSDDALETVLMRWMRGTELAGLRGPRAAFTWNAGASAGSGVRVVRPLLALRREEVRTLLAARGLTWREDSSNADTRFTRNRVRNAFLPLLEELGGEGAIEDLRAFSRAVEELEGDLARLTAHLAWREAPYAAAARGLGERALGGVLARAELMPLARPLMRRALWRLLTEGTGAAPSRTVLERVLDGLTAGRTGRHALAGGWHLVLRARELVLVPPRRPPALAPPAAQPWLPFPAPVLVALPATSFVLPLPGILTLPDGRRISAELVRVAGERPVPREPRVVELDARELHGPLGVRFPAPGDRFHALGAPGSKRLVRYLADRGIPREERAHVPLVTAGAEILWVVGCGPCERRRVRPESDWRVVLALHG
jgi:tRNA(Ile)-lysidine synthase